VQAAQQVQDLFKVLLVVILCSVPLHPLVVVLVEPGLHPVIIMVCQEDPAVVAQHYQRPQEALVVLLPRVKVLLARLH